MNMEQQQRAAFCVMYHILIKQKTKKKKCWVRKWIQRRQEMGACSTLVNELKIEDAQQFINFVRMSASQIEVIINLIGDMISKKDTNMRKAIPVKERVIVTLRFLASGMYL